MLLVETNNRKEQSNLQQQFSREGNLFAVPIKKTQQITQIIQRTLFQIFGHTNNQTQQKHKKQTQYPTNKLITKLLAFFDNILKLNFSLSIVREMFQIIKIDSMRIKMYQEYFGQMDLRFEGDSEQCCREYCYNFGSQCNVTFGEQEVDDGDQGQRGNGNFIVYDTQIGDYQDRIQCESKKQNNHQNQMAQSKISINCHTDSPINQDAQTMHTLRSQFKTNPNMSISKINQFKMDLYKMGNNKLQNSFDCSEDDSRGQDAIVNVQNQMLVTERNADYVFYCPDWKKSQDGQKKILKSIIQTQTTTKISKNDSSYIQNLSGRIHPVPSFLHNDSLGQMIVKQKRQDARKSSILRKSILNVEEMKTASEQTYSSNLRLIKFQNKRRKNSKNCLTVKSSGTQDIKQSLEMLTQSQNKQSSLVRYASDKNLLKVAQNYEKQLQKQKQRQKLKQKTGTKLLSVIQSQNLQKIQLASSTQETNRAKPPKGKGDRHFNFFKSKK